MLKNIKRKK